MRVLLLPFTLRFLPYAASIALTFVVADIIWRHPHRFAQMRRAAVQIAQRQQGQPHQIVGGGVLQPGAVDNKRYARLGNSTEELTGRDLEDWLRGRAI